MLSCFSCVWLFVTPWTIAHQATLSVWFSREEYWSGLPCPPPGGFPTPGIEPMSLISPALAGGFFTTSATWEAQRLADPPKIWWQCLKMKLFQGRLPIASPLLPSNSIEPTLIFPTLQNNYLLLQIFRPIRGRISISFISSVCLAQGNILPQADYDMISAREFIVPRWLVNTCNFWWYWNG